MNCCCNKEIQEYGGFTIMWNITLVDKTVVIDCKGDGLNGSRKLNLCIININTLIGNVTRTCGLNNEWLPAKINCIHEQFSMILAEVCLTHLLQNLCIVIFFSRS